MLSTDTRARARTKIGAPRAAVQQMCAQTWQPWAETAGVMFGNGR